MCPNCSPHLVLPFPSLSCCCHTPGHGDEEQTHLRAFLGGVGWGQDPDTRMEHPSAIQRGWVAQAGASGSSTVAKSIPIIMSLEHCRPAPSPGLDFLLHSTISGFLPSSRAAQSASIEWELSSVSQGCPRPQFPKKTCQTSFTSPSEREN